MKLLKIYSQEFPLAWRKISDMREARGKKLPFWPEWCYCPIAGSVAVITEGTLQITGEHLFRLQKYQPAVMAALAGWRITKGIYKFDETLLAELIDMPLEGTLPADIFYQLPEWCIYILTPGMKYLEKEIDGFFVYLECDANDNRHELRLVFVSADLECSPLPIHLGKGTVEDCIYSVFEEERRVRENFFKINFKTPDEHKSYIDKLVKEVVGYINLVLYICSVNSDLPERPVHPIKKPRRKGKVQTAQEIKLWDVGVRIGPALRSVRTTEQESSSQEDDDLTRRSPRPHYRRAHWHHYWTGPKNKPEERKLILKWLPPIPVGIPEFDDGIIDKQPAVIYPINRNTD